MSSFGRCVLAGFTALLAASAPELPETPYEVLQFGADAPVDIDKDEVPSLRQTWSVSIPEQTDSVPLYVSDVPTDEGTIDLLIIATNIGRVMALETASGQVVWQTNPPAGVRWTTSAPAVDPQHRWVFAYCLDGFIHRYALNDGHEVTGNGWPQLITTKTDVEKGSSSIRIATAANGHTYLYLPTAAYPDPGDEGDYQGHVTTIDIDSGDQWVFNAACSDKSFHLLPTLDENDCGNQQSGIWARAGVVYDARLDRVFVSIGNGVYDAAAGGYNWGSSIVALRPDGSVEDGLPLDSYTPPEHQQLTDQDLDLSSSAVEILPEGSSTKYAHLGVHVGKDGKLRLLNLEDLSGQGGPGHIGGELASIQGRPYILTRPIAWKNPTTGEVSIFVVTNRELVTYRVSEDDNGKMQLTKKWQTMQINGTSPVLANGILYFAAPQHLYAIDATDGTLLWEDNKSGPVHWQSPIVIGSSLYLCDGDRWVHRYDVPGRGTTPRRRRRPIPRIN
jgi:outer membrane protein assembly factor BamB